MHRHTFFTALIIAATSLFTVMPSQAQHADGKSAGDWLIRARAIAMVPDESSTVTVIGGETSINDAIMPELDFSYFFTDSLAAELILATTNHDVTAVGTSLGEVDLGDVWVLPPTLTLQYHFAPKSMVSPYVGAGINLTLFYAEDAPGGTVTDINYSSSVGPALQAGVDVQINNDWMLNFDVKKVWLNSDVDINGGAIMAEVDLDPWVFGVGFGTKF